MLKKSTYIMLSLLLCIPLIFIIYFSLAIDTEKPTQSSLLGLTVTSRDGFKFTYTEQEDLSVYLSVISNSNKTENPVRDLSAENPTVVTHTEKDGESNYNYYMSLDTEACYFSDTKGSYYQIDSRDAALLAARPEFSYLYENYTVPTLTISSPGGNYSLGAKEGAEWKFKRAGEFADGFVTETEDPGTIAFKKDDSLSLSFSTLPTKCTLTVYNGAITLHSAEWASFEDGDDISSKLLSSLNNKISYTADTPLTCEISAEWVDSGSSNCYGTASYTANLLFDVPVSCETVDARLSPGEFTFLKLYNLNDDQTVTLVSDDPAFTLPESRVHKIDDMTFVFLPIDLSSAAGTYNVRVVAGDEETSFKITVNSKNFPSATVSQIHGMAGYDSSKNEFTALISRLTAQSVNEHLWNDAKVSGSDNKYKFVAPIADAAVGSPAFGTKITEDPNLLSSTPYIQTGMLLEAAEGTDVHAIASGNVIYVGELSYSGKTVVIDHGFGMLSVYENLSEISINTGDSVEMNSVIGKTGKTGYIFNAGTRFSLCLEGVFINPATNYNYGISY